MYNFMYTRLNDPCYMDNRIIGTRAHDAPLFMVKIPKIEMYKRSVRHAGAVKWNNPTPDLRGIKNFQLFKAKQKAIMAR